MINSFQLTKKRTHHVQVVLQTTKTTVLLHICPINGELIRHLRVIIM